MSLKTKIAQATSAVLTWGLKNVAHRTGGSLPGKVALTIDPSIVAELRYKMREGSVVVVGTNGKTTVTNLLASVFKHAGRTVLCNYSGANLKYGIATTLLQSPASDWGVLECDELWLAKVVPDVQPTYILLLDLFRDQLDRCGEIDRIQDSILDTLASSPATTLIFNADDPLCAYVAEHCENATVAFGVGESMGLEQNRVADATMCQNCLHMFEYDYRQYGQLGSYRCANCGFARPALDYSAQNIKLTPTGFSFDINEGAHVEMQLAGSYMVYNALAVAAAALESGCALDSITQAVREFNPRNGRLERFEIDGHATLLNLAKNPTGFNQNLRIVEADSQPRAVAFFINDKVVDGRDISWIWDIDFEEIAGLARAENIVVYAGGTRKNDLQVRLKYAGVAAKLIEQVDDVFADMRTLDLSGEMPANAPVYAIVNYSAMAPVKARLEALSAETSTSASPIKLASAPPIKLASAPPTKRASAPPPSGEKTSEITPSPNGETAVQGNNASEKISEITPSPIVVAHVLPDLLNLYGDGGNVRILEQRLNWRGIPVEVCQMKYGDPLNFDDVDLVVLGGGPDREQRLATEELTKAKSQFQQYIDGGGPLLAICGGYQILGRTWLYGEEEVPGLGILGLETRRPGTSADRIIGNVAIKSEIASAPVVGFENHAGRTYLDAGVQSFGQLVSKVGGGNNDDPNITPADGVLQGSILGTYFHGVLLSKNPEVADWLLERAIAHHIKRTAESPSLYELTSLDDSIELEANRVMCEKLI